MNHKNKSSASKNTRQLRIIGGQWKRSTISVIDAEGLRPTPDRVRETVFNWINHLLDGAWSGQSCLDLFAGSGALGFEAASRGAAQVLMVEAHAPAFRQLQQVREKLQASQVDLLRADAHSQAQKLAQQGKKFNLIFLDPPFQHGWLEKMLPLCAQLLARDGLLYVEAEYALSVPGGVVDELNWLSGWQVIRADRAGNVYFQILQRSNLPHELREIQA